ncbi:sensor histidine kinase [Pseudonocardia sp. DLS-67]
MTSQIAAPIEADPPQGWPDRFAGWADTRLTRVGLTGEFRRDCALAVVLCLVTTVLLLVVLADPAQTADLGMAPFHGTAAIVVTAAQSLVLCIRRVSPVLCLWVVALLQVMMFAMLPAGAAIRGLAPAVAAYGCGALLPGPRAARVVAGVALFESTALVVANVVPTVSPVSAVVAQALSSVLTYTAGALFGAYVATRRQYVGLVRVRAAEAVEAQRARADAAIGSERARMARELHDIAAHHLSGMVVQTAVVERLIDRDPQAAKEAAAWIRAQGKETLHNLRLVVGALRGPGQGDLEDGGAPVPGLAVLDRLVQAARELGTPVVLVQDGERKELPPIADITFYRVTQEALSNAREHAPGAPARVVLRYGGSEVSLAVENEARPAPDRPRVHRGFGLAGMRERAQLIGAEFDAGPTAAGGWRVSLRLPADRETASPHAGAHRSAPRPGTRLTP